MSRARYKCLECPTNRIQFNHWEKRLQTRSELYIRAIAHAKKPLSCGHTSQAKGPCPPRRCVPRPSFLTGVVGQSQPSVGREGPNRVRWPVSKRSVSKSRENEKKHKQICFSWKKSGKWKVGKMKKKMFACPFPATVLIWRTSGKMS